MKNPNRLVSSGPGTPPQLIHDGKSGQIRVRWNRGGTGTYSSVNKMSDGGRMRTLAKKLDGRLSYERLIKT